MERHYGRWLSILKKTLVLATLALGLATWERVAIGQTLSGGGSSNMRVRRTSESRAVKQELLLISGIQTTLDIGFDPCNTPEECLKVANKGLVAVQFSAEKKQLLFTPAKKGETSIQIRDSKGDLRLILKVVVSESNLTRRFNELKDLLKDIDGLQMRIMADKIVIDGEVLVVSDLNRLYAVISDESYKAIVMNLVGVSPVGMQVLAERMQAEINKPAVKVRVFNGFFLVEGQVDSGGEADQVMNVARTMVQGLLIPTYNLEGPRNPFEILKKQTKGLEPVVNRLTIAPAKPKPPAKTVRLTVDFVELSKDYYRNFGFAWMPSLDTGGSIAFGQSTTGGVTTAGSGTLSGTIANLFPKLATAQNSGYARILEEAVLVVKSGEDSKFERTLDVPVQSVNAQGQPTFSKQQVGPKIKIKPTVSGQSDDVDVKIEFAYNGYAGKAPSGALLTLNHSYNTVLTVRSGESAAIVNAISNAISTAFNKDPPGATPTNPLFTLLRSKAFQKSKSQFVVFVTPQVIETAAGGTEDIKTKYGLKKK